MLTASQTALYLIEIHKEKYKQDMSLMKLNKLLFYCQSWCLKSYDKPLFDDVIERWESGPVIGIIFHSLKSHKDSVSYDTAKTLLSAFASIESLDLSSQDSDLICSVFDEYGKYSDRQLAWMSTQKDTAWSLGSLGSMIKQSDMIKGKC